MFRNQKFQYINDDFIVFAAKGTLSEDTIRLFLRQLGKSHQEISKYISKFNFLNFKNEAKVTDIYLFSRIEYVLPIDQIFTHVCLCNSSTLAFSTAVIFSKKNVGIYKEMNHLKKSMGPFIKDVINQGGGGVAKR